MRGGQSSSFSPIAMRRAFRQLSSAAKTASEGSRSPLEIAACAQSAFSSAVLPAGRSEGQRSWSPSDTASYDGMRFTRGFSASGAASFEETDEASAPSTDAVSFDGGELDSGSLLSADAINYAASSAEAISLAEAWDEAWIINKTFQYLIQAVHGSTGLAWWQSIGLATAATRLVTLPLAIKQMQNTYKMTRAKPDLERLAKWFKEQQAAGRQEQAQKEYMTRMAEVWAKHDCNPLKSMLPLFAQAPIFIGFFQAIRSLAAAQVPSMAVGGPPVAWYSDLTIADPYYTLPIMSSLLLLLTVELNAADGLQGQDQTTIQRTKNLMRALSVLMLFGTSGMPQGVFYYWITSSMLALGQSTVFKFPGVRKLFGLPSMEELRGGGKVEVAGLASTAAGKPIKTFAQPPKRQKGVKPGPAP